MARPPLPIGERGEIKRTQLPDGTWQALCRYRDTDGVTRRVKATGPSGQKAENTLKRRLKERSHGTEEIKPETALSVLAEKWFATVDKSPGTKDIYRRALDGHIIPKLGSVRIREASTGRLEAFLAATSKQTIRTPMDGRTGKQRSVRHGGPSAAKTCRTVLGLMMAMAVRYDAADYNAIRETTQNLIATKPSRALTVEDFETLRANVIGWQGSGLRGPVKSQDLVDKIDVMIGSGLRPGELFALRWEDVDFESTPPTVEVTGTVKRSTGAGLHRQEYPKSESGERILYLPRFAALVLEKTRDGQDPAAPNPLGLVFPSRAGTVIDPGNFRRQWREARGEDFDWVKPSSFRKTVATIIEREVGRDVAAKQLGHSSSVVTMKHYVQKDKHAPDSSQILDRFGGN